MPVLWSVTTSVPSGSSSTRSIEPAERDRPTIGQRRAARAGRRRTSAPTTAAMPTAPAARGRTRSSLSRAASSACPLVGPERRRARFARAACSSSATCSPACEQDGGVLVAPAVGSGRLEPRRRARRGGGGRWRRAGPSPGRARAASRCRRAPRSAARRARSARSRRAGSAAQVSMRVGETARRSGGIGRPVRLPSYSVKPSPARASRSAQRSLQDDVVAGRRQRTDVGARAHAASTARAGGARRPRRGTRSSARPWAWESTSAAPPRRRSSSGASQRDGWCDVGGPQVAAGHGDDDRRRRGDGGEELAVDECRRARRNAPARRPRARGRRGADRWSVPAGAAPRRRPSDDGDVDVEPGGPGERADVDAVADLAVSPGCDVELGDERGAELGPRHRRADAVEVGEAVEHPRGLLPGQPSAPSRRSSRPGPNQLLELLLRPRRPRPPTAVAGGVAERRAQLGDERQQLARRRRRRPPRPSGRRSGVGGVPAQAALPVGVAHDAGGAPDALPPRGRHDPAVGAPGRHVAEQRHQVAAAQPAPVELEQLGEHPRHHPLVDRGARAARSTARRRRSRWCSTRRAYGRSAGKSTAMRSNGVPPRAASTTAAHGDAHLVVGVGGRHDLERSDRSRPDGRRSCRRGRRRAPRPARRRRRRRRGRRSGRRRPRRRRARRGWRGAAARAGAAAAGGGRRRARAAPAARRGPAPPPGRAGRPRRTSRGRSRRATSAATRAGSLPRSVRASAVIEPAPARTQLAVQVAQRDDGRRVVLDAGVEARDCRGSTRRTARSTTGVETGLRPSAWSDGAPSSSASRNSVSTSMAANPPRRPSARRAITPAVFVGTTTATGASGSPPCGRPHGGGQRVERGGPVGGGGDVDPHAADVGRGCQGRGGSVAARPLAGAVGM